jgi:hypothetical protein
VAVGEGVGVFVAVGAGVVVDVAVAVGDGVGVIVAVGEGVEVGTAVGDGDGVQVAVRGTRVSPGGVIGGALHAPRTPRNTSHTPKRSARAMDIGPLLSAGL